ncbi:MAG TPA: pitrilysin family protein [Blastocatellia bacterium]|nr:pitrilysin family protein [Blastocatellia bacterium]
MRTNLLKQNLGINSLRSFAPWRLCEKSALMRGTSIVVALALTVVSLAPGSLAQQPQDQFGPAGQSIKGAVLKGKAPVNKDLLKVKLPRAGEATLKNGLRVLVLENHRVPTFSIDMVILSGGLSDPPDHRGLASFTASLLREGTSKRSSKEIAEQVDALGASLTAVSSLSSFTTSVRATGLVENFGEVLDLFADVILNAKFPVDEVDKFKARTISQLQFVRSNPRYLAQERFNRAIYGDHPAGLVSPSADSIKKTTVEDLAKFRSTYYRPNNAMLAIVGDVTLKNVVPEIERVFGSWERAEVPQAAIEAPPAQGPARLALIDRPGSVQTFIQLGVLGIQRTDPDYFPLLVMDKVVGGGPSARLFMNLREDKGYTYGAYSNLSSSIFRGVWGASSEVRTEVTDGAMHEFMYEVNRIRDEKVSTTDLENAKRSIIGGFALSLEQPAALLQNIVNQKLYKLPADYWDTYPAMVAAVTADDIQRVARKYIDPAHLQIVAVGDGSKIRDVLSKYGALEVYGPNGNLISSSGDQQRER